MRKGEGREGRRGKDRDALLRLDDYVAALYALGWTQVDLFYPSRAVKAVTCGLLPFLLES